MPLSSRPTNVAASKREAIVKPKKCGLIDKNKPVAFIIQSPYDASDSSTKYKSTVSFLEQTGFGVLNKKACDWNMDDKALAGTIKAANLKGAPLTIWIEAHGALGWFFAGTKNPVDEFNSTAKFIQFIKKIAVIANASLGTVVLNGCFTSSELFNHMTHISRA